MHEKKLEYNASGGFVIMTENMSNLHYFLFFSNRQNIINAVLARRKV